MASIRRLLLRVFNLLRPERADAELTREIAAHLALIEDDLQQPEQQSATVTVVFNWTAALPRR